MKNFDTKLKGVDLRSIGKANEVVKEVNNQTAFDTLFKGLFHTDRKVVMRISDAIEKITVINPAFLQKFKKQILALLSTATI